MSGKRLNLRKRIFGLWTVIEPAENLGQKTRWLCKCICGTVRPVTTENLVSGLSNSCGCKGKEWLR
jgi:hypothetical protein